MSKLSLNPFKRTFTEKEKEMLAYFHKIRIFEALTSNELALFLPYFHEREYQKDEVVFFRGDPSRAMYILKSGAISLSIDYQDDLEELTTISEGQAFGESCLLPDTARLLNAIVISPQSHLYVIPQLNVHEIFENNVVIKAKIFSALAEIYHEYNNNLFEAYRKSLGFFHLPLVYDARS